MIKDEMCVIHFLFHVFGSRDMYVYWYNVYVNVFNPLNNAEVITPYECFGSINITSFIVNQSDFILSKLTITL